MLLFFLFFFPPSSSLSPVSSPPLSLCQRCLTNEYKTPSGCIHPCVPLQLMMFILCWAYLSLLFSSYLLLICPSKAHLLSLPSFPSLFAHKLTAACPVALILASHIGPNRTAASSSCSAYCADRLTCTRTETRSSTLTLVRVGASVFRNFITRPLVVATVLHGG